MKDLINKLTEIDAAGSAEIKSKQVLKESAPIKEATSPLKQLFNELNEALAPGQKPMPVVGKQGDTQNTGAGFLNITDTSPTGQAMQKALSDLAAQGKAQIVVPNKPGETPQQGGTIKPGTQGNQQQSNSQMQIQEEPEEEFGSDDMKKFKQIQAYLDSVELKNATKGKVKEEEQLDELSPKTLKSYAKKADIDHVVTNRELKNRYHTGLDPELLKKSQNRTAGMKMAGDKVGGRAKVPANEGAKVDRMVKHIEKSEKKLGKSKGEAEDIAWATANKRGMLDNKNKKKVKEGDIAPTSGIDTKGAGLGAGRSATTLEGKKPDFLDLDKDGNKKESMKKAAADKKKQKVDESMNHRINAARFEGKAHGLKGHAYHGKSYEDLEEARAYHEGYKEGLDECYGQGVYETAMPATVGGMANAAMPAMEDEMGEGNAFTAALARTPKGGKFSLGGKTFTDRSSIDEYAFESLDRQLSALLNESEEVSEGLSVSISKGQQNAPDSVTITAQDAEADQLLGLVKQAGLGIFGGEESSEIHSSEPHADYGSGEPEAANIEVVDDHDDMMGLMRKLSGIDSSGSDDEHEHDDYESEEQCNECGGMMEEGHSCGSEQAVEEESGDTGAEDTEIEADSEAEEDADLADADSKEDNLNEWANNAGKRGTDASFEADIEFMTKVIAGGLNKPKSTGQTTVPVIAGQEDRMHDNPSDWATLAGIKKS